MTLLVMVPAWVHITAIGIILAVGFTSLIFQVCHTWRTWGDEAKSESKADQP